MTALRKFKPVTHVIFDLDGVILDTEKYYTQVADTIARRYGKSYTWELKVNIMGKTGMDMARSVVELLQLPITPEEYYEMAKIEYKNVMPNAKLLPGAARLIKHLRCNKIPMAVATSSHRESFDLKSKFHKDLFAAFNHIVCGGDDPEVKEGKPKPDIFLVCASRFPDKPAPEKCLVFEDSPNGVRAAVAAHMQAVMVPDENIPPEMRKEATVVITSLEDAPLELFNLPPLK